MDKYLKLHKVLDASCTYLSFAQQGLNKYISYKRTVFNGFNTFHYTFLILPIADKVQFTWLNMQVIWHFLIQAPSAFSAAWKTYLHTKIRQG